MIGLKINDAKKLFFDRALVMRSADRAARKVLSKFGAYVRTRARTSIRAGSLSKMKKAWAKRTEALKVKHPPKRQELMEEYYRLAKEAASKPGEPPRSWGDRLLRKFILFVFEPFRRSVVIGPAKLNGGTTAPEVLEYGGQAVAGYRGARRSVRIEPRPYMRPAFDRELPKVPQMWRDVIKP